MCWSISNLIHDPKIVLYVHAFRSCLWTVVANLILFCLVIWHMVTGLLDWSWNQQKPLQAASSCLSLDAPRPLLRVFFPSGLSRPCSWSGPSELSDGDQHRKHYWNTLCTKELVYRPKVFYKQRSIDVGPTVQSYAFLLFLPLAHRV